MSRFSRGDRPSSQALRACTISASAPAAFTFSREGSSDCSGSWSSMPIRHFTVTGMLTAAFIAATHSATSAGLGHQAGAEAAFLHAVRGTADIEIDFAIAEALADARASASCRDRSRRAAGRPDARTHQSEQPLAVAVDHRAGRDHLGIEQRPARQQPVEEPAMPVSPFHHRRDAKAPLAVFDAFCELSVTWSFLVPSHAARMRQRNQMSANACSHNRRLLKLSLTGGRQSSEILLHAGCNARNVRDLTETKPESVPHACHALLGSPVLRARTWLGHATPQVSPALMLRNVLADSLVPAVSPFLTRGLRSCYLGQGVG